jgi:hypothetical protein
MAVSREDLYKEVWAEPMTRVAARHEVSSSFLARVCQRLNVPRERLRVLPDAQGQRFYRATMPKIAEQLERLNANLEALLAEFWKQGASPATPNAQHQPDDAPK